MSLANEINEEKNVTLDNEEISSEQFNEKLRNLDSKNRIVEISSDNYTTVTRMHG